jgi:rfaE bifunctional protein kinase chain/domain/rfaE bifunctional protein nucleotidyltransferase chain/domain
MSLSRDPVQPSHKLVSTAQFASIRERLRQEGKKVAHCHGVFDLLHPGHIAHLTEAKSLGDVLVVSITSAPYVNRGPGRPYFSDELRMNSLAALSCVDYVLLAETPTAMEIIDVIQPDYYVKGQEYAASADDVTGNIDKEVERVRTYHGDVHFTGGVVFSSTKLINQNFSVFPPGVKEFCQELGTRISFEKIKEIVEQMKQVKVMVVGDIIIDEYVFCAIQGLTSKDRTFSARYEREEQYLGGSLAIARHLANFSDHVTLCGVMGDERQIHSRILNDLGPKMRLDLRFDPNYRTVFKRRFIERRGIRNEYDKLFSVNYLANEMENDSVDRKSFYDKLEQDVASYDLIVVADYGHGLLDEHALDIIQTKAKRLAVNCQTNSSNYGMNLITKYRRADIFTVDDRELHLAMASSSSNIELLLKKLMKSLQAQIGWVTRGSHGSIVMNESRQLVNTPALTLTVQDTVGAGDAFYALASLSAQLGIETEICSFFGNIAGALAANILGNAQAIEKGAFLKFAETLLKF